VAVSIFVFLPEIDKDASVCSGLLFPYTLDALDVYALMRMVKTIVPASHGLLRMSPKSRLQPENCVKVSEFHDILPYFQHEVVC
jgi:hypothetical protein